MNKTSLLNQSPVVLSNAVTAAGTLATGAQTALDIYKIASAVRERSVSSITEYTKDSNIIYRMLIDQRVAEDPIMIPLASMLNTMMAGYVLTAMQMNTIIVSGKTVKELTRVIATEAFVDAVDLVVAYPGAENDKVCAMEGMEVQLDTAAAKIYCGRVLQLNLVGEGGRPAASIYVYMQILPTILSGEVIDGFVKMNFRETMSARWRRVSAGDLKFWSEFIGEADRVKERETILKADRTGIIRELEDHRQRNLSKSILGALTDAARHNVANFIIVADRAQFMRTCTDRGLSLQRVEDRNKLFRNTMSTALVLVDTSYSTIELYLAGLTTSATYNFSMINTLGGKKDGVSVTDVMAMLAAGQTPKF